MLVVFHVQNHKHTHSLSNVN